MTDIAPDPEATRLQAGAILKMLGRAKTPQAFVTHLAALSAALATVVSSGAASDEAGLAILENVHADTVDCYRANRVQFHGSQTLDSTQ